MNTSNLENHSQSNDSFQDGYVNTNFGGLKFLKRPLESMFYFDPPTISQYITLSLILSFLYFFVLSFVHIGLFFCFDDPNEFLPTTAIIILEAVASSIVISIHLTYSFKYCLYPKQYNWVPVLIAIFFWIMVIDFCHPIISDYNNTAWPLLASKYFLFSSPIILTIESVINIVAVVISFIVAQRAAFSYHIPMHQKAIAGIVTVAIMGLIFTEFTQLDTVLKSTPIPVTQDTLKKSNSAEKPVEVKSAETKKATTKNINQEKLDKTSKLIQAMRIPGTVEATSYESNDKGFIAIIDRTPVIIDVKNNQYAKIDNANCLQDFAEQVQQQKTGPIIVRFAIPNDTHDQDENAGFWDRNTHHLPVYILWTYENNQPIDNGLFTGNGQNPHHYETYLYESKNVTLAHIFLSDSLSLLKDAQQRGLLK